AVLSNSKALSCREFSRNSPDNYQKTIAQLQNVSGEKIYLCRSMARRFTVNGNEKRSRGHSETDLPALYDELEAKILALESLGRTQDKSVLLEIRLGYVLTGRQGVFEKCNGERDTVLNVISFLTGFVIGLSADIENAFLQLGIGPKHRNVLRFFYPDEGEIVHRHCRVVWGRFVESLLQISFILSSKLSHRILKELLRRTLGKAIFTHEELLTVLCECEKVVNSRPLTYLSEDMQDLTPITPARFLFETPTADTKYLDVRGANHFGKSLRFRAKIIEELKRRFNPQSSNIQVGDIVLIGDDWKNVFNGL
ncbi:integrase catalytic domain-containing protein, partial [Trichonephila clavipes]